MSDDLCLSNTRSTAIFNTIPDGLHPKSGRSSNDDSGFPRTLSLQYDTKVIEESLPLVAAGVEIDLNSHVLGVENRGLDEIAAPCVPSIALDVATEVDVVEKVDQARITA